MINNKFFNKKIEFLTLGEVLEITKSKLENNNIDLNQKILAVSTLTGANKDDITFVSSGKYSLKIKESKAGFCLMEERFLDKKPSNMIALINSNPYFAYALLLNHFYENNIIGDNVASKDAIIEKSAKIGKNVKISNGAYIGHKVILGDNVSIGVNSVICDNVSIGESSNIGNLVNISHSDIGKNAIIHSGVKIGQDGFGFAHNQGVNYKILQLGMVEIGDDVEIGANTCIDRGAIENTIIGNQVKLDNFVQIAHNVQIGEGTVIAGAAGVAGSTKVGKFCQIGGHASVNGHITIGDGAKIAGASGVVKSVEPMQSVGGYPALPIKDWHKITLKMLKLIKS